MLKTGWISIREKLVGAVQAGYKKDTKIRIMIVENGVPAMHCVLCPCPPQLHEI